MLSLLLLLFLSLLCAVTDCDTADDKRDIIHHHHRRRRRHYQTWVVSLLPICYSVYGVITRVLLPDERRLCLVAFPQLAPPPKKKARRLFCLLHRPDKSASHDWRSYYLLQSTYIHTTVPKPQAQAQAPRYTGAAPHRDWNCGGPVHLKFPPFETFDLPSPSPVGRTQALLRALTALPLPRTQRDRTINCMRPAANSRWSFISRVDVALPPQRALPGAPDRPPRVL